MTNKIIDAICIAISNEFGEDYKIYTDNVEQGFSNPCFLVSCINTAREHFFERRYSSKNSFTIHYFPSDTEEITMELHNVSERLFECLECIDESGDLIRGREMKNEIVDSVLNFMIDFDFFIRKERAAEEKMHDYSNYVEAKGD